MTDPTGTCNPPTDLDRAIAAFRRHAFAALVAGGAPRVAEVAETASRDALDVAQAVTWLETHGQLERDGELLVGAHGLTRRRTPHSFSVEGRTLHTWCAYDAVAIPVALRATARAATTCPTCQRPLVVNVDAGHLPAGPTPVLWLPTGPCEHVIDQFCAYANLFCSPEDLDTWRQTAGNPPGGVLTLAAIAPLALREWGDISPKP